MLQQKNLTNPPAGAHGALHICALYGDHHGVPDESGHHVSRIRNGASLHDKCDECLPGRHASGFLLHPGCPSCCYPARRIDRSRSLRQSACPLRAPGCDLARFSLLAHRGRRRLRQNGGGWQTSSISDAGWAGRSDTDRYQDERYRRAGRTICSR